MDPEETAWGISQKAHLLGSYEGYLQYYPLGKYAGEAKNLVYKLSDADTDGILNSDDRCPNEKGTKTLKGCPIERVCALNEADERNYLIENRKKTGVFESSSGLLYEVLYKSSSTNKPRNSDQVKVKCKGYTIGRRMIDSTYLRYEPTIFQVDKLIEGLKEGLKLMCVGDKYKFSIPSRLAYKDRNIHNIEPCQLLLYEIELVEIIP